MKLWTLEPKPGLDALTPGERASSSVGPRDVKVAVRAVSLNYRDLIMARGAEKRKASIVPASDGAGEVIEVGAEVTSLRVGERVVASFFPTWLTGELSDHDHANALGGGQDGMLREEVVLPAASWVRFPDYLSFEEAATLPCAGLTAWQALFEVTQLRAGDTVLLQGSGGVSVFALQLARAVGARAVITSGAPDKHEALRQLGAWEVIDYKVVPTWGARAKELTGGRGVDLVVDVGGPATFDQAVAALRYGGAISLLGVLTGTRGDVNLYALFHRRLHVHGVYVGSVEMFERFMRALDTTRLRPVVDRVFDLADTRAAYEHLASGRHLGKVVVRVR